MYCRKKYNVQQASHSLPRKETCIFMKRFVIFFQNSPFRIGDIERLTDSFPAVCNHGFDPLSLLGNIVMRIDHICKCPVPSFCQLYDTKSTSTDILSSFLRLYLFYNDLCSNNFTTRTTMATLNK